MPVFTPRAMGRPARDRAMEVGVAIQMNTEVSMDRIHADIIGNAVHWGNDSPDQRDHASPTLDNDHAFER
jgi:hypothetical protein